MFKGDFLNVTHGFHNLSNKQSYFGMVFADCNRLSSRFHSFSLSCAQHDAYIPAYFLPKFVLSSSNSDSIEDFPPYIASFVKDDYCLMKFFPSTKKIKINHIRRVSHKM